MIMDKMDGTGEQGQRGVHALACAVAFSSPFWFLERPLICEFVRLYANILAYFEKKYFFQILWPSSTGLQWVGSIMTVEGIAYRRRAKASTVGSESSGCRLSPPFAAICPLIDGGRVVKRAGFLLVPGGGCGKFPALVDIKSEIAKRRTFAIISHPDAGKTTLTEKLLLYGGAVQLAGSVTARKNQRASTSDWMELERKRGISISSTVLQFDYDGYRINLLDTPGHKDFSEDTYRVLTAVDAVVMVIDAGKGIEAQTRKLFEVCKSRGVPIFTFMNKCDRPNRDTLALLDELDRVLKICTFPINWPLGSGSTFRGVYDRQQRSVHLFERTPQGAYRAPVQVGSLAEPFVRERLDDSDYHRAVEELEMLDAAGVEYSEQKVHHGEQTPVFFGSAMNNFGVQLLLDAFLERSLPPQPRRGKVPSSQFPVLSSQTAPAPE